jgi:hypothetical protein
MLAEAIDELGHLTQALEIEQMRRERKGSRGVGGVICRAEGDSGMAAVGQTDDDVGALAVADADDGESLSAERMVGMRNGHESRRVLGGRGSAL